MPLEGVRVLDLGCYLAGPLAGMLLADQGAEVIKIDPPTGPRFDHPVNAVLNRGKILKPLDLKSASGKDELFNLVREADILIENFSPDVMDLMGFSVEVLQSFNPRLIIVSLPGFPRGDINLCDTKAYEGLIAAATGQYTDIHPVRNMFGLDPLYTALPLASVYGGVHAATASVLALRNRGTIYTPCHIEVPLAAAAFSAMSSIHLHIEDKPERYSAPRLPAFIKYVALPLMRRWAKSGQPAQAKLLAIARKSYPALMTSYACKDGEYLYIFAIDNGKISRATLSALGLLEQMTSAGLCYKNPYLSGDRRNNLAETSNLSRAWQSKIKEAISERMKSHSADVWEKRLIAAGVPCARQQTTKKWMQNETLAEAGITVSIDDQREGQMLQPGLLTWFSGLAPEQTQPKPCRTQPEFTWKSRKDTFAAPNPISRKKPVGTWLSGLMVIDMCSMVAGPVTGRTLSEYGARVIKVENPDPGHGPRMTCWYGIDVNQGKESILLDLKTRDGKAAMVQLLQKADILLTNHLPAAMEALGLGEAAIQAINPRLIYCKIGAFNGPQPGHWDHRHGYDPVLQAAAGIMTRYGDPDHPELHAIASCVDALTGYAAAFGTALALYNSGQHKTPQVVASSLAAAATLVQLPFAFVSNTDSEPEASGQQARGENAFYRLYQAIDGWLFLAAHNDKHIELAKIFGETADNDTALQQAICARIQTMQLSDALVFLDKAGIAATPVRSINELRQLLPKSPIGNRLHLCRQQVDGLGQIVTVPAQQVSTGGTLNSLTPAEKPGTSSEAILQELGLDANALIKSAATVKEITNDYLPS